MVEQLIICILNKIKKQKVIVFTTLHIQKEVDLTFRVYLLQLGPVIDILAHEHSLQLLRPKQLHQIWVTHLEEATLELLERILHGCVEDVIYVGIYKLLPGK